MPASYRSALSNPTARRLVVASLVSNVGDFVALGALIIVAVERSGGRAVGAAGLFAVQALPALALGTVASGWLAQRDPRRWLISSAFIGAAALAFLLATPGLWAVYVTACVLGLSRAIAGPMGSKVTASQLPGDQRTATIAMQGTVFQVAQVAGLVVGGLAAAGGAAAGALGFDLVTFLVAAVLYRGLQAQPTGAGQGRGQRRSPLQGVRVAMAHPVTRSLLPLAWVTLLLGALPEWLMPTLVDSAMVGPLIATNPAAAAIGAFLAGRDPALATPSNAMRAAASLPFALLALAASIQFGALLPALVAANVALGLATAWIVLAQGAIARSVAPDDIAQINATMVASVIVLEGAGSMLGALVTDLFGAGWWLLPMAAVTALVWLAGRRRVPRAADFERLLALRAELDGPAAAGSSPAAAAA